MEKKKHKNTDFRFSENRLVYVNMINTTRYI